MMIGRFQFTPFWRLTQWGFLFGRHEDALRIRNGGDEWHNPSRYLVVPLVGIFVWFAKGYDTSGPEHVYAVMNGVTEGAYVEGCAMCEEFMEDA